MGLRQLIIRLLGGYTCEEKECARNEGHEQGQLYCAIRIKEFMKGYKNKDSVELGQFTWLYINAVIDELIKTNQ